VAVLWIDAKAAAAAPPIPLRCAQAAKPPSVAAGQELFTISAPLREAKSLGSGTVSKVEPRAIASDLMLATGSAGGPAFTADGSLVGITTPADDKDGRRREAAPVVRIDAACAVLAAAEQKMKDAPPVGTHLPVEPARPFPLNARKDASQPGAGSQSSYQISSSDFDVAFLTPTLLYSSQDQTRGRDRGTATRLPDADSAASRALLDFSNWSEYVADYPPVLMIRVTPKLVEGFWTTVARGAARTQGVAVPPIKHFKSGFSRLRAFCGAAEVTPIHPFKLEQRVSESDAIYEGLYVFDPGALGPQCGTVKLVLYSDKEPAKGDTRVVDPKTVQEIWRLFAPYREG
jgi:hypothetical protein